jgi:hypothetical protein
MMFELGRKEEAAVTTEDVATMSVMGSKMTDIGKRWHGKAQQLRSQPKKEPERADVLEESLATLLASANKHLKCSLQCARGEQ